MQKLLYLALCCWLPLIGCAQVPTILDSANIAPYVKEFHLEDGHFTGPGAHSLSHLIDTSQFIVLGEVHGSSRLSTFVQHIAPVLAKAGYHHFACEVGPHTAQQLMKLSNPPDSTSIRLQHCNQKYRVPAMDSYPIPFFSGVEDAAFLAALRREKMDIWGLDQEYYDSHSMHFDRLLQLAQEKKNIDSIRTLHHRADKITWDWLLKEDQDAEGFPVFEKVLAEPVVQEFFAQFGPADREAYAIIRNLKISWDIYNRYRGGASHADRIRYMRDNFEKKYRHAREENLLPRVLIKIGRLHGSKSKAMGVFDVGHLAEQIASREGTICTNIAVWQRFYREEGKTIDLMDRYARHFSQYAPLIQFGQKDSWVLIDLGSIREEIQAGRLSIPANQPRLKQLIDGYDYQLIVPTDRPVVDNY